MVRLTGAGYVRVHRKGQRGRLKFAHVLTVERVLGHPLPKGARVHHFNGDKTDNRHRNLVVCQDQTYHLLLHSRQRALAECGNPNFRQCWYCRVWDDPTTMRRHPRRNQFHHLPCAAAWQRKHRLDQKGAPAA